MRETLWRLAVTGIARSSLSDWVEFRCNMFLSCFLSYYFIYAYFHY